MEIDKLESFHLAYRSFIDELNALAQPANIACEIEGHYNVAHEFWYLIPNNYLLKNEISIFETEQIKAMKCLFSLIKAVPPEARIWTEVAEESLKNLNNPAWEPIRSKAARLLTLLQTVTELNSLYFDRKY